jgi:hypothetical protein
VTTAQRARFDERFGPLAAGARELVRAYEDAVFARFEGGPTSGVAYPEITVVRLMVATNPLYETALLAITTPEASLGAHAMLRPLIEAWGHLDFIEGQDEADRACRALRVELGTVIALLDTVQRGADDPDAVDDRIRTAEHRKTVIEDQMAERSCKGDPRAYRHSTKWVRDMAKRPNLDWLAEAWSSASMTLHLTAWDWRLRTGADGAVHVVDSPPKELAARLNHLVVTYASLAQTALRILSADGLTLHEATSAILNSSFLSRAIDGDFG